MKIAIDARALNAENKHGIYTYSDRLINGLSQIDSQNEYYLIYTSLTRKAEELPGPPKPNFSRKVIRFPDRDFSGRDYLFGQVALPMAMSGYKCDIFHSTFDSIPFQSNGTKYVLTVHDLKSCVLKDESWQQDLEKYTEAFAKVDAVIAVSQSTKNDIIKYFAVPDEKITVTHLGVDPLFHVVKDKVRIAEATTRYGITKKYFLCMGSVPRKNLERLIRAYAQFKYKNEYALVLGGVGSKGDRFRRYSTVAHEEHISDYVQFLGYIKSDHDLNLIYNGATCFAFPSLYEGFGLPVLEAMAAGTPVITSNVSSLPEVAGEAALIVDPYRIEDITAKMNRIVEDGRLREELVAKGQEQVKKFDWQKTARATLNVYEKCVKKRS